MGISCKLKLFGMAATHHCVRSVVLLLLFSIPLDAQNQGPPVPELPAKPKSGEDSIRRNLDFHTDMFTGRLGYEIPIFVAPARQGTEPRIALGYNSGNGNDWCGVGWDLDVGFIQRDTRFGVPTSDAAGFTFSVGGKAGNLVYIAGTEYRSRIEGAFVLFEYSGGFWKATDQDGTEYLFGQTAGSRQVGGFGTFRWSLNKVTDKNGNVTEYEYTTDQGRLYLSKILYNKNATFPANLSVEFEPIYRSDTISSAISGRLVTTAKLLDTISSYATIEGVKQLVRRYKLTYSPSQYTGRSLLWKVKEIGNNGVSSLPEQVFTYSQQQFGFNAGFDVWPLAADDSRYQAPNASISGSFSRTVTSLIDLNGDGYLDRVSESTDSPFVVSYFRYGQGTGAGFNGFINWSGLQVPPGENTSGVQWGGVGAWTGQGAISQLVDLDADGRPERVLWDISPSANLWFVQRNTGNNFGGYYNISLEDGGYGASYYAISRSEAPGGMSGFNSEVVSLLDINGDGLPDRLMRKSEASLKVWPGRLNASGLLYFGNMETWPIPSGYLDMEYSGVRGGSREMFDPALRTVIYHDLIDINGDGLPDRVISPSYGASVYKVQLNTGRAAQGFVDSPTDWGPLAGPSSDHRAVGASRAFFPAKHLVAWADINTDGLPDRVIEDSPNISYQLNTGSGFGTLTPFTGVAPDPKFDANHNAPRGWHLAASGYSIGHSEFVDVTGDGIPDRVNLDSGASPSAIRVQRALGGKPDLLKTIENGIGGDLTIEYLRKILSTGLPHPTYVVSSIQRSDGFSSETYTYTFQSGYYDRKEREFRGFATSTAIDPLGTKMVSKNHQATDPADYGKQGIAWNIQTWGDDGALYKEVYNRVTLRSMHSGKAVFPYISQTAQIDQEGLPAANHKFTVTQFQYNNLGNLTRQTNFGRVATFDTTTQGFTENASTVNDERLLQITYNPNLGTVKNRVDLRETYQYTAPTSLRSRTQFEYFPNGNLWKEKKWIDHTGWYGETPAVEGYAITEYGYDPHGNVNAVTDPVGLLTSFTYDAATKTHLATRMVGNFTDTFKSDLQSGFLTYAKDPKGLVTEYLYDPFFRLTREWESLQPNGPALNGGRWKRKLDYFMDGIDSDKVSHTYVRERINDEVDADGHEVYHYADGLGRPIQTRKEHENGGFRVTDIYYDVRGQKIFTTWPRVEPGLVYTPYTGANRIGSGFIYDPIGRINKEGSFKATLFNHFVGEASMAENSGDTGSPLGLKETKYRGQLVNESTDPWITVKTDAEDKKTKYRHNAYGQIVQVIEMNAGVEYKTSYQYNSSDQVTQITDAENNVITFAYDSLGRKKHMLHPDLGTWDWLYDSAGRETATVDGAGNKTEQFYLDAQGRMTQQKFYRPNQAAPVSTTTYSYDLAQPPYTVYPGQLAAVTDKCGTVSFGYDLYGNVTAQSRALTGTPDNEWFLFRGALDFHMMFAYDAMRRIKRVIYTPASIGPIPPDHDYSSYGDFTYIYDSAGHLKHITGWVPDVIPLTYYSVNSFDSFGRPTQITYGNGTVDYYEFYQNSRRPKQRRTTAQPFGQPPVTERLKLDYKYTKTGNLSDLTDVLNGSGSQSLSFTSIAYDDLHRLTQLTHPSYGTKIFDYTKTGNLKRNSDTYPSIASYAGESCPPQITFPHAIKNTSEDGSGSAFCYIAGGLMANNGLRNQSYSYDERRLLVQAGDDTFGYDYEGRRLWMYGWRWLAFPSIYMDYSRRQPQFHVFADGKRVMSYELTFDTIPYWQTPDGLVMTYYHSDYLGSTRLTSNGNGEPSQAINYSAFGDDTSYVPMPAGLRFGYTGKQKDEGTQLYYYESRYYDPALGRFLQPDFIFPDLYDPQLLNPYTYVRNNPFRFNDPDGHRPWDYQNRVPNAVTLENGTLVASSGYPMAPSMTGVAVISTVTEAMGAAVLTVAPEPTLATKAGAVLLWADVGDKAQALFTGNGTYFQHALEWYYPEASPGTIGTMIAIKDAGLAGLGLGAALTRPVSPGAEGPYSALVDHPSVGPFKPFTQAQKRNILRLNRERNNGPIRSDESGTDAVPGQQSKKGVTPPDNEAQIDHIIPRSKGGPNSYKNAQVLTRKENLKKSDNQ